MRLLLPHRRHRLAHGLEEAVDEKTGDLLISHVLNRPDAVVIVASNSERLRGCAAQILGME